MAKLGWPWTVALTGQRGWHVWLVNTLLAATGFLMGAALAVPLPPRPSSSALQQVAQEQASDLRLLLLVWQRAAGDCGAGLASAVDSREPSLFARDPWGQRWVVRCYPKGLVVRSLGQDGIGETADDIVAVPEQIARIRSVELAP